jgi:hypothetical protein
MGRIKVTLALEHFTEHAGGVNFVDSVGYIEDEGAMAYPRIRARLEACFPGTVFEREPDGPPPVPVVSTVPGTPPVPVLPQPEPETPEPADTDDMKVKVVKEGGKVKAVVPRKR